MIAVRDAESRTRFIGWRPENVKLFAFVVSAVLAGIAGALYVPQVGIINPGEFDPGNSIEAVIWVAVGGRGTIVGPVIGAIVVNVGKTIFTGSLPELWLFALGALFVATTLFLPRGILGVLDKASPIRRVQIVGTAVGLLARLARAPPVRRRIRLLSLPDRRRRADPRQPACAGAHSHAAAGTQAGRGQARRAVAAEPQAAE